MVDSVVMRSLPLVAGLIGRTFGVSVIQDESETTASVDQHKVVRIAPLRDVGTQEEADLVIGKIIHECVHLRFGDMSLVGSTPLVNVLENILEDVFGEREQAREYPGAPAMIGRALEIMVERGLFAMPSGDASPAQLLTAMLICGLRSQELGQAILQDRYEAARAHLEGAIGTDLVREIWETALQVRTCKSTARAFEIADEIQRILKQQANQPEQPQQGQGNKAQAGPGNNGQQSTPPQGQKPDADGGKQPQRPSGSNATPSPASSPTPEQLRAVGGLLVASKEDFGATDFGEALSGEMRRTNVTGQAIPAAGDVFNPNPGQYAMRPAPDLNGDKPDSKDPGNGVTPSQHKTPSMAADIRQRTRPIAFKLGTKLESLLEGITESQMYPSSSGRRIMRERLNRLCLGKGDVFRRQEEAISLNTAVAIVQDISASMADSLEDQKPAIDAAEEAAWAVGDVLEKHEVPFSLYVFGRNTTPIKRFDDGWRKASRRVWASLEGNTITHLAIRTAVGDLVGRPEDRKLMLLITDGAPSSIQAMVIEIQEAQRAGIEVAMLFIAKAMPSLLTNAMHEAGLKLKPQLVQTGQVLAQSIFAAVEGALKPM